MAETYRFLEDRLQLPGGEPLHTNATGAHRYRDAYDPATIRLVRRRFAADLALFGYDYDSG